MLTVAAGALFGEVEGTVLVVVGATLGSTGAFILARGLGRDLVQRFASQRVVALDARIRRNAFRTVLVARLVPVLPFTALSYTFGLSAVPLRSHGLATLIGIIPGSAMYVAVGAFGLRPVSWPFAVAVLAVLALGLAAHLRRGRIRRRLLSTSRRSVRSRLIPRRTTGRSRSVRSSPSAAFHTPSPQVG